MKGGAGYFIPIALAILGLVSATLTTAMLINAVKTAETQRSYALQQIHEVRMHLLRLYWSKSKTQSFNQWVESNGVVKALASLGEIATRVEVLEKPLRLNIAFLRASMAQEVSKVLVDVSLDNSTVSLLLPESFDIVGSRIATRGAHNTNGNLQMRASLEFEEHNIQQSNDVSVTDLHAETATSDSADSVALSTDTLIGRHGDISELDFQDIQSSSGILGNTNIGAASMNEVSSAQLLTESADVKGLVSVESWSEELNATEVKASEVVIRNNLVLSGDANTRFLEAFYRLEELQTSVTRCVQVSLWCLAAEPPKLSNYSCEGCSVEQIDKQFSATLHMHIESCIHGCSIQAQASNGAEVMCDKNNIPPHEFGDLVCWVSHELTTEGEYNSEVVISARNLKSTSVSTYLVAQMEWIKLPEHNNECAGYAYFHPIYNSTPQMFANFVIPTIPLNEVHTDIVSGRECEMLNPASFYNCRIEQKCGSDGNWLPVNANCICET
ncbi:hypothetical protein [Aliidiomarina sp. B3213]|nr:hypothetical protein [Aliidiomarina sp. B3213]